MVTDFNLPQAQKFIMMLTVAMKQTMVVWEK